MRSDIKITVQDVSPAYYELLLDGVDRQLVDVLTYRGGELSEPATRSSNIEKVSFIDAFNLVPATPVLNVQMWRGKVSFHGVNDIKDEVIIEPGTNILLGPSASLIFHNRVTAVGTKENPIRFSRGSNEEPWGTLALQGNKANGSRFSHCLFTDGSGYKSDLLEYSGMFSVHEVNGLAIDQCRFQDSHVVDDMVHAVYSDLKITNSEFSGALFDALDLDLSRARIENSTFTNNGNDSIDVMTSDLSLFNSSVVGSGDKGVSVGEGSRLLAINDRFQNNAIGVQSKDGSVATLYNVDLVGNKHAIDAYKKNWRYASGGYLYVYKSKFVGNEKMVTADKQSKIDIYDTSFDKSIVDYRKKKRVKLHSTALQFPLAKKARELKFWRYPSEIDGMRGFSQKDWELADAQKRGSKVSGN